MIAKDIMVTEVITVSARATIREALMIMAEKNISGLPVVNDHGDLVGIISESDIIHHKEPFDNLDHWIKLESFLNRQTASEGDKLDSYSGDLEYLEGRVEDIMTRPVITAAPETPLEDIARTMVTRKINRIPVVKGKRVAGIITRGDILQAIKRRLNSNQE